MQTTTRQLVTLVVVLTLGLVAEVVKASFIFGEPTNLGPTVNSSSVDGVPTISGDGLELYFTSDRPGGHGGNDIWVSRRSTTEDEWGRPMNLGPIVNSSSGENSPSISADGLALYFGDWPSPRAGGVGGWDIWVTTRPTKDDDWDQPVNLESPVNSGFGDGNPSISGDGLELYFMSDRPGGEGGHDIWVARRPATSDPWGDPVNLGPPVNTSSGDCCPSISADGRTLFFGGTGDGSAGYDLWMTTRASVFDLWREPSNLGPTVNSSIFDDGPSISADGSTLFFFSNRPGGIGSYDLWQALIIPVVDFNGDGKADNEDMNIMVDYWHTDEPLCDIGPTPLGDGMVDAQDMLVLTEYLAKEKRDIDADIAAIDEVLVQYGVALSTGDFELWLSIHADDVVKMPPDAPAMYGQEELRAGNKFSFDNFIVEGTSYPEETRVDGDMGFTRGNYKLTITPKAGGDPAYVDGKYLTLCKRQADGSWKISHDCYNSNVPPAQ